MTRVEVRGHDGIPGKHVAGRYTPPVAPTWYVVVMIYEQEMWETLTHAAQFPTRDGAERLATRVRDAVYKAYDDQRAGRPVTGWGGLNLDHWMWYASPACPFEALQKQPTANPYRVGA
jgi:hypothetical protein